MIVDLHMHSHCSDGELSPEELVRRAVAAGITAMALTDHDSVAGVQRAAQEASQQGVQIIPGLELSSSWKGQSVHIVGLGVNIHEPSLIKGLQLQAEARGRRAKAIADKLESRRMVGAWEGVLALADGDQDRISRTHFAQWLLQEGHVNSMQGAFDKWLGQGKPAEVPMPWPELAEAVGLIQQAGGVAVLAHPGRYPLTRTKMRMLIEAFKDVGGEAMEVATATEKPDMVRYLGQLSVQYGLEASQGSDFHGAHMPWIHLGRFPTLPVECQPVWRRWLPV